MDETRFSISPHALYLRLGVLSSPIVVDVRRAQAFAEADTVIVGAVRRPPEEVESWRDRQPLTEGRPIVVYCVHGHEVSQAVAASLREAGLDARYLEGGIAAWAERGLPLRNKLGQTPGRWVTRERPKVDRIACPWLIRRFVDPEAEFIYVPTDRVFATAEALGATAYDIPGAEPFSHEGELCSFDGFLKIYGIADPALDRLALIVRGADTARPELTPQSSGLLAVSLGLSANFGDNDHAAMEIGMHVYDALYAWCRSRQDETHSWDPSLRA
jgi:rhodanese-related sulfurtransferase